MAVHLALLSRNAIAQNAAFRSALIIEHLFVAAALR
jgi:hypothetical protein